MPHSDDVGQPGCPRGLSLSALTAIVSLVITIGAGGVWTFQQVQWYATALVAGRTATVHLCEQTVGGKTSPCQTVLQYKAFNPGPAVLENVGLRVSVKHAKNEKVDDWLEAAALGPADLDPREYSQHTVYRVAPPLVGNSANRLDPGAVFGISLVAVRPDWEPDEVYVSWGASNEIPAKGELRLEGLFQSRWLGHAVVPGVFLIGAVLTIGLFVRLFIASRNSGEYRQLQNQLESVKDAMALQSTSLASLNQISGDALSLLRANTGQDQANPSSPSTAINT